MEQVNRDRSRQLGYIMKQAKIFTVQEATHSSCMASKGKKRMKSNNIHQQRKWISLFSRINRIDSNKKVSNGSEKIKYSDGLYGLLVLILCIFGVSFIALVPVHNLITNPDFWPELILQVSPNLFIHAAMIATRAQMIFGTCNKTTLKIILDLLLTYTLTIYLSLCFIHLVWTTCLTFIEPFPFRCILVNYISFGTVLLRFWFILPKKIKMNATTRKRQRMFLFYILWSSAIALQLMVARKMFDKTPLEFQWVIAILVPILKEINDLIIDKLIREAATPKNIFQVRTMGKLTTNIMFSFWIAVFLATSATETSGYVLLGINFCFNLILCKKAIKWENTKIENQNQSFQNESLIQLVVNETIELIAPVTFIGSYLLAFYGPNYETIGNVGCSYWTFQGITDLNSLFMPVIVMALIDFGSAVVSGILLWKWCRINIFKEYCKVIKCYWVIIALSGAFNLYKV